MPTVRLNNGVEFEAGPSSIILDSAAKFGVLLPYSCKTGRCSSCKCKVLHGKTRAVRPETGLTEEETEDGWILSCVRIAETDLTIEIDDLGEVVLPTVKTLPCRISHLEPLATDVIRVKLRLPPTAEFAFIPGQYIDLIGPNGIRRSYSLANAGFADKVLELHIRAVYGGEMSEYWFKQAKVNDLLRLNGPLGTFFLRDTADVDLVFLATGTGIAPIKAMLESLTVRPAGQTPRTITVLWGGRVSGDLYFDVTSIIGKHTFIPVLSRAENSWTGKRGHVQNVLLSLCPDLSNTAVYACGSDIMIHSAKQHLIKNGLSEKCFYSDAFVCSSAQ